MPRQVADRPGVCAVGHRLPRESMGGGRRSYAARRSRSPEGPPTTYAAATARRQRAIILFPRQPTPNVLPGGWDPHHKSLRGDVIPMGYGGRPARFAAEHQGQKSSTVLGCACSRNK
jgi:hypothetical protein